MAMARGITVEQLAMLCLNPMAFEAPAVLDGFKLARQPEPLVDLEFGLYDHLEAVMYSALRGWDALHEYHLAVSAILLETRLIKGNRYSFVPADVLGLLLVSAIKYPASIKKYDLQEVLQSAQELTADPHDRSVIGIGMKLAPHVQSGFASKQSRDAAAQILLQAWDLLDDDHSSGCKFWPWLLAKCED
jgi:hypothetical protein